MHGVGGDFFEIWYNMSFNECNADKSDFNLKYIDVKINQIKFNNSYINCHSDNLKLTNSSLIKQKFALSITKTFIEDSYSNASFYVHIIFQLELFWM